MDKLEKKKKKELKAIQVNFSDNCDRDKQIHAGILKLARSRGMAISQAVRHLVGVAIDIRCDLDGWTTGKREGRNGKR